MPGAVPPGINEFDSVVASQFNTLLYVLQQVEGLDFLGIVLGGSTSGHLWAFRAFVFCISHPTLYQLSRFQEFALTARGRLRVLPVRTVSRGIRNWEATQHFKLVCAWRNQAWH